ncbi:MULTISPECIES: hypothetical protein [unclassified Clostridium]|uniref:hypothetical protein n=1 Tax=unclassified Clostridium TaxID=2614128 RepID=UPI00052BFFB8|nr:MULTISPECIES: hypothetical protein [unclassified Clostridium]KGK85820.1 hypothetical protein DP68_15770 [Clostridium sp. HMP27]
MENVNKLIDKQLPHITTNTVVLIIMAIIAFYILMKVISGVIKIIALIAVCWFVLMTVQSTNIISIPIVKQAYVKIEKIIPSKELWTKASDYIEDAGKLKKAIEDLK